MTDHRVIARGSWADDFQIRVGVPRHQDVGEVKAQDRRAVEASQTKRDILRSVKQRLGVQRMEFLGAVPLTQYFALQRQIGAADFVGDREEILTRLELIAKPR